MARRLRKARTSMVAALGLAVLLGFQNCGTFDQEDSSNNASAATPEANWWPGYSEYSYVVPAAPGVCANGSVVRDQIRFEIASGNPATTITACEKTAAAPIPAGDLTYLDPDQGRLQYQGNVYYLLRR